MTVRILVVCTANICRSPMAEALLAEYLARHAPEADVSVASAGTRARPGYPAAGGMREIATAWGLDLELHRSRRIDAELVEAQDLVLTMEHEHRDLVSLLAAGLGERTFTITELGALVDGDRGVGGGLPTAVRAWHRRRARRSVHAPDIADPYGLGAADYERTAWELADHIEGVGPALVAALTEPADDRTA